VIHQILTFKLRDKEHIHKATLTAVLSHHAVNPSNNSVYLSLLTKPTVFNFHNPNTIHILDSTRWLQTNTTIIRTNNRNRPVSIPILIKQAGPTLPRARGSVREVSTKNLNPCTRASRDNNTNTPSNSNQNTMRHNKEGMLRRDNSMW